MILRIFLFILVLMISQVSISQQEAHWNIIDIPDVNKNINVKCFAEDSDGFIWLGANSGLFRFDGYSLKEIQFGSKLNHVRSVKNITVSGEWLYLILGNLNLLRVHTSKFNIELLYTSSISKDGQIVDFDFINENTLITINSKNVLLKFNLLDKTFISNNIGVNRVSAIQKIAWNKSQIWLGTRSGGLEYLDKENKLHATQTGVEFPYPGYNAEDLCFLNDSTVIYGGWDNALHFYNKNTKTHTFKVFDGLDSIAYDGDEITSISKISENELWFGTKLSGVYSFDRIENKITSLKNESFLGSWVYDIFIDSKDNRWVATDLGINLWVQENQFIQRYSLNTEVAEKNDTKILSIATNEKGYLFGNELGLFYLKSLNEKPRFIPTRYKDSQLEIHSILWENSDNPILGTNRSLYSINLENNQIQSALPIFNSKSNITSAFSPLSLISSRFTKLLSFNKDEVKYLLSAAYGYGLLIYNTKNGESTYGVIAKDTANFGYLISSVIIDNNKKIWASCKNTGIFYDLKFVDRLRTFPELNSDGVSFSNVTRNWGYFSADKHWINDGINGLKNQNVLCLERATDSTYFVGTDGGGLYYFDPQRKPEFLKILHEITTPAAIFKDSLNRLWFIENGNLIIYDYRTENLIKFNQRNGIINKGIFPPLIRGIDGYLYACGTACFYRFKPESYLAAPPLSDIEFTNLKIQGHKPSDQQILSDLFNIHESQSVFSIYFTSLNYNYSNDINYKYSFANGDNTWIDVGNKGYITFTQLAPGNYKILVRAYTMDDIPISNIGAISFVIEPYWYNSWWFRILTFLSISLAVYSIYKYRIKQLLRVQIIRDQIARDLHDDIGSTLGAINISTKAAQNNLVNNNSSRVIEILDEIGSYSREMSEHMGDIIWAVNPENDELVNLLKRIQFYAKQLLEKANIGFNCIIDDQIKDKQLSMEFRRNIYLIIKEALNNAVKYSNCKLITLSITKVENKMKIVIADDGIGYNIQEINSMNGNGLNSISNRCKEMNASLKMDSSPGNGCHIEILINSKD